MKIFYLGKGIQPNQHTSFFKRFPASVYKHSKQTFKVIGLLTLYGLAMQMYGSIDTASHIVNADTKTVFITSEKEKSESPVMQRIAGCESEGNPNSKGSHRDKKGNVRINTNANGTKDVGKNQINSIWFLKAMEMKLNVLDETDNQTFADWLYANYGTEPWFSSKACWNK